MSEPNSVKRFVMLCFTVTLNSISKGKGRFRSDTSNY